MAVRCLEDLTLLVAEAQSRPQQGLSIRRWKDPQAEGGELVSRGPGGTRAPLQMRPLGRAFSAPEPPGHREEKRGAEGLRL